MVWCSWWDCGSNRSLTRKRLFLRWVKCFVEKAYYRNLRRKIGKKVAVLLWRTFDSKIFWVMNGIERLILGWLVSLS